MPTNERSARFDRDWESLSPGERDRFRRAVRNFVLDLASGSFRAGLRVKAVQGADGIFEMTWAPDGRATFQYGRGPSEGAHVIWRRVGSHREEGDLLFIPAMGTPIDGALVRELIDGDRHGR